MMKILFVFSNKFLVVNVCSAYLVIEKLLKNMSELAHSQMVTEPQNPPVQAWLGICVATYFT